MHTHTHTHTYTHTRARTHTHTHTRARAHSHTHMIVFHGGAGGWVSEVFISTDAGVSALVVSSEARSARIPEVQVQNLVEGNGHVHFSSCRQLYLSLQHLVRVVLSGWGIQEYHSTHTKMTSTANVPCLSKWFSQIVCSIRTVVTAVRILRQKTDCPNEVFLPCRLLNQNFLRNLPPAIFIDQYHLIKLYVTSPRRLPSNILCLFM